MAHRTSLSPNVVELDNSALHETKEDLRIDQLIPEEILSDKTRFENFLNAYYAFMNMDEFIYQENNVFDDIVLDGIARFRIPDPDSENDRFFTDETGANSTLVLTSPTGVAPAEFTFDGSTSNIVDTSGNQLKLSALQIGALPIGTLVQYDAGLTTNAIGGLTHLNSYYVVTQTTEGIQLSNSKGGTPITISGVGTDTIHKFRGVAPTMEIPLNSVNVAITNGNELPGTLAQSTSEIGKTFTVNGLESFNNYTAKLTTIAKYWVGPGPSWVMNKIEEAMDIDKNENNYLELMQKEIASAVPRDVTVNKRNLYKRIIDFYKLRGSSDSIEIFFRLLFDDSVEVEFPFDKTLVPSSGKWDQAADVTAQLASAVNNTSTLTIKEENNAIKLSSRLVVGTTYTKLDDIRVTGIAGKTITIARPKPTLFDSSDSSIVDTTNNSIKLSSDEIAKYPVGTKLTYRIPTGGTVITGLADGTDYFVVAIAGNSIKLSSTEGGSVIDLTGLGGEANHELVRYVKLNANTEITFVPRGTYLDNKGFVSYDIKLQDSLRYQRFSYLIKTGKNLSDWEFAYDKLVHPAGFIYFAEILIFLELVDETLTALLNRASMPFNQPGVIGPEDIPVLVEMFASQFLPSTIAKIHKSATLSLGLKNGVISGFTITNGGSGYLTAPTVTTNDSGTPSGFTAATITSTIANGSLTALTIADGGKDYNVPVGTVTNPPRIQFDGSDDEVAGVGIVNLTDNTIKLTALQAAALPIDSKITYDSGEQLAIGGLVTGDEYYIVYNSNNEVKLSLTSGGSVIDITSVGGGTDHGFTGETATFTLSKTDGQLESITVAEPGYGYTTPPAISFSGVEQSLGSGNLPVATIAIDSDGRLDGDNITISNNGGGWSALFATAAANPNAGTLASVDIFGLADKTYRKNPEIAFSEPDATDTDGNPLPTNVTAQAKFLLEPTSISQIDILNPGFNYPSNTRLFFSQPANTYTASPFFTEDYENFSLVTGGSQFALNTWVITTDNGTHTASVETSEVDTGSQSLKIQTSALDTDSSGIVGGVAYKLELGNPDFTERLANNTVKVKVRAKADSSNSATFFEMAYSTSQYGNSGWQRNNLTTDWADYEFEYNISTTIPTNADYIGIQGDGNDGIVYIDNVSIEMKYDYPRASIEILNGKIISAKVIHSGSGYRENPTITFNTSGGTGTGAQAFAFLNSSEINGVTISNAGNGYGIDPTVRLNSAVHNEQRVADQLEILVINANHNNVNPSTGKTINPKQSSGSLRGYTLYDGQRLDVAKDTLDASTNPDLTITQQTPVADKKVEEHIVQVRNPNFRTIINNGYKQRKGTENFFTSSRLYNTNQTIEFLGNNTLQTIDSSVINNYNTSANVHIE